MASSALFVESLLQPFIRGRSITSSSLLFCLDLQCCAALREQSHKKTRSADRQTHSYAALRSPTRAMELSMSRQEDNMFAFATIRCAADKRKVESDAAENGQDLTEHGRGSGQYRHTRTCTI
jgi:hypothetical protein